MSAPCKTCGGDAFAFHRCPPLWRCRMDWQFTEEAKPYWDDDAGSAATRFAADHERRACEYPIASGRHDDVVVVIGPDGKERRFAVRGEAVPRYWATEVTP